jgi:ribosomal 30S subunit maturation factor RimM
LGLDIRDWDLEGWEVVLEETGEAVGRVEEVLSLASYWDPSVVEYCLLKVFDSSSPGIEYLIPWVEDVVKEVDAKAQCILIKVNSLFPYSF